MTLSNNAVTHAVNFTLVLYDSLLQAGSSRVIGVAKKGARERVCVLHLGVSTCGATAVKTGYMVDMWQQIRSCEKKTEKKEGFF